MTSSSTDEILQEPPTYREIFIEGFLWIPFALIGLFFASGSITYVGALVHLHIVEVSWVVPYEATVESKPTWKYLLALVVCMLAAVGGFDEARKRI